MAKYTPKTREELRYLVEDDSIYLGDIDTSNITDMFELFERSQRRDYSGIELWDTSNVLNMDCMFYFAESFNQPIDSWDTSKVVDMTSMFNGAKSFNQPLNSWDTSNVVSMSCMFDGAKAFNQPLDKWDTSNVIDMADMFCGAKSFNQNIDSWNVSNVKVNENFDFKGMFKDSNMDSLPIWYSSKKMDWRDSVKITYTSISKSIIKYIEKDAQSNKYVPKSKKELWALCYNKSISLGDIDTSNIVDMSELFRWYNDRSDFSGIDSWDTSKVADMANMFFGVKSFNEDINSWDTSNVVSMYCMFCDAKSFNQPLDSWDISSVEFMTGMFEGAESFNQNLNLWNVSSVRDNQRMFWDSGMNKLPKWYKKRAMDKDVGEPFYNTVIKKRVVEAVANPRPKKPKIAPQDKPQSNTDWGSLFGGSSKPALTKKSIFRIIGATLFFVILAVVAINFDDMRRSIKRSNSKATTQTTQTAQSKQQQPAQQPTTDMIRCDDSGLLKHLMQSYKNGLIDANKTDLDTFAIWQETYRKYGINLTSAEELVNGIKYNIINVRTKSSDEVNKRVECEVEIEEVYPVPQSNPHKSYNTIDYRAQIADNNRINFGILKIRSIDK